MGVSKSEGNTDSATITIQRMKMLMEMIDEAYEAHKTEGRDYAFMGSQATGSVKHLACELGKLCSKIRREV